MFYKANLLKRDLEKLEKWADRAERELITLPGDCHYLVQTLTDGLEYITSDYIAEILTELQDVDKDQPGESVYFLKSSLGAEYTTDTAEFLTISEGITDGYLYEPQELIELTTTVGRHFSNDHMHLKRLILKTIDSVTERPGLYQLDGLECTAINELARDAIDYITACHTETEPHYFFIQTGKEPITMYCKYVEDKFIKLIGTDNECFVAHMVTVKESPEEVHVFTDGVEYREFINEHQRSSVFE